MGCERKRAIKYDSSVFGLSDWMDRVAFPEVRKLLKEQVQGQIRNLLLNPLHLRWLLSVSQ